MSLFFGGGEWQIKEHSSIIQLKRLRADQSQIWEQIGTWHWARTIQAPELCKDLQLHSSDFLQPGPYPTSWHLSLMLWHLSDVLLTLLPSESLRGPHSRWGWEMSLGRNKQAESLLGRTWGNTRALPNSDSSCLLPSSPQPRGCICLHGDFNSAADLCQLNRVTGKPG